MPNHSEYLEIGRTGPLYSIVAKGGILPPIRAGGAQTPKNLFSNVQFTTVCMGDVIYMVGGLYVIGDEYKKVGT